MCGDIDNGGLKDGGIDGDYHGFEVENEEVKDGICGMKGLGMRGFKVSVGEKVEIME